MGCGKPASKRIGRLTRCRACAQKKRKKPKFSKVTRICAAEGCGNKFVTRDAGVATGRYCSEECKIRCNQCENCGTKIHRGTTLCVPCLSTVVLELRMCAREGCYNEFEITSRQHRKQYCSHYCNVHEPCISCGKLAKIRKGYPTHCRSCGCTRREYSEQRKCVACNVPFTIDTPNQTLCQQCIKLKTNDTGRCVDCGEMVKSKWNFRCWNCSVKHTAQYTKQRWQDEENRKKHSVLMRQLWHDEDHRRKVFQGLLDAGRINPDATYPIAFQRIRREGLIPFRAEDRCEYCGGVADYMDIHHIDHNPKNNCPTNLIYLCRRCHLFYGHTDLGKGDFEEIARIATREMPIGWHESMNAILEFAKVLE